MSRVTASRNLRGKLAKIASASGGAIGDDWPVFPIPPGKHWRDAIPVILPETPTVPTDQRTSKARGPKTAPPLSNGPVMHAPQQFRPPSAKQEPVAAPHGCIDGEA